MQNKSYNSRTFYSLMLSLAVPIALQQLISISLNTIDTLMIGSLGEAAIAAVGICNRVFFFFVLITFGIYSGMSIFTAQYWGNNDSINVKKMMGMQMFLGVCVSLVFILIISCFPGQIMSWFIKDSAVIALGKSYFRIVVLSYIFMACSFSVSFAFRSLGIVKVPLFINVLSVLINAFLNWVLIFGHLSIEPMGVSGAALATLIARIAEFFMYYWYLFKYNNKPVAFKIGDLFLWNFKMMKDKLKIAFPVVINETLWSLGMTVIYIAYGKLGADSVAAVQISYSVNGIFEALFFGLGNACAVMLGNEIGRGNYELAKKYSNKFIFIMVLMGAILGLCLIMLRNPIISIFNIEAQTIKLLNYNLIVLGLAMPFSMCSYLFAIGILRSGGDTKFCMYLEMASIWLYVVPVAFIASLAFNLPTYLIIALINIEHLIKLALLIPRYKSGKWINNLVKEDRLTNQ